MATLTVQEVSLDGQTLTTTGAASGGDEFENQNGRTFLYVENEGAAAQRTVTISSQETCNQGQTHDETVDIADGDTELIGPFDRGRFNDANGNVQVSYDTADVDVAAVRVPDPS